MSNNKLLITQSFIVDDPGTYWDYRDYIFCLCSNLTIRDSLFRLNIERGQRWLNEFVKAADHNHFSDLKMTNVTPNSWADYMINEIESNKTIWTMPWPGDHIYVNENPDLIVNLLNKAEKLEVDAVAYSHIQDWDYFLDWEAIEKIYEDTECVVINWGHAYKFYRNHSLIKDAMMKIHQFVVIPPVPGYLIYKSDFFKLILKAIPFKTKRWQDMEYSPAKEADKFKVLIPKQCLYRHVHGYWLEVYLNNKNVGLDRKDLDTALKGIYVRSNYDWRTNNPNIMEYKKNILDKNPYFAKYFLSERKNNNIFYYQRTALNKTRKMVKRFFYQHVLNNLFNLKKTFNFIFKLK